MLAILRLSLLRRRGRVASAFSNGEESQWPGVKPMEGKRTQSSGRRGGPFGRPWATTRVALRNLTNEPGMSMKIKNKYKKSLGSGAALVRTHSRLLTLDFRLSTLDFRLLACAPFGNKFGSGGVTRDE